MERLCWDPLEPNLKCRTIKQVWTDVFRVDPSAAHRCRRKRFRVILVQDFNLDVEKGKFSDGRESFFLLENLLSCGWKLKRLCKLAPGSHFKLPLN